MINIFKLNQPVDLGAYRREKAPLKVVAPTEDDLCNCPACSEEALHLIRPQILMIKA